MSIFTRIWGGWKTWGPNRIAGDGAFSSKESAASSALFDSVSESTAMRVAAFHSCVRLRAETQGTLPIHLRDDKKNLVLQDDLLGVLKYSPNSMQTAPEYWSQQNAIADVHGNSLTIIKRRSNKSVISLEPMGSEASQSYILEQSKSGKWSYKIGADEYDAEDILHIKGFGMDGLNGLGLLTLGRNILQAQISANVAALQAFKQGLKVGGFLSNKGTSNWTTEQVEALVARFDKHALPENAGKWMPLLTNMEPIAGEKFSVKPADAQLLESRYFGIEEICRLACVPPQLIGHSDKASSWASSLEHVNLFYLVYGITPSIVRKEATIMKRLIPRDKWGKLEAKFSVAGLLRSDLKSRTEFYASSLQNGYLNRDEVRDLEERASIDGGDKYTVQTNLTEIDKLAQVATAMGAAKQGDTP